MRQNWSKVHQLKSEIGVTDFNVPLDSNSNDWIILPQRTVNGSLIFHSSSLLLPKVKAQV
jgi:hypothetical protein